MPNFARKTNITREETDRQHNNNTRSMNDTVKTHQAKRYRQGVVRLANQTHFTHWLTLNTHRECSLDTALKHLKRWRVEVFRRVHGRRFYELPADLLTEYMGCPELSAAGHPHFHLAVRVPAVAAAKFERAACHRWDSLVGPGSSHLVPMAAEDQPKVLSYATKWVNPQSSLPFVHSRVDW